MEENKKENKWWTETIIFCLCFIIFFWGIDYLKNKEDKIDYDYSNYAYEDVFYRNFEDIYDSATKTSIRPEFSKTDIGAKIIIIDENLNPITDAKIKLYDDDRYYIATLSPNKNGIIAINNFPKDYVVNIEQTETRKGLKVDKTIYFLKNDKVQQLSQIIINSENDLSEEQRENIKKEYREKNKLNEQEESITRLKSMAEKSEEGNNYLFRFIADDLIEEKIQVNIDDIGTVGENENKFRIAKCSIRIPNASVEKIELIEQQDWKDNAEILDMSMKPVNTFKDGESFYLKYKSKSWMRSIFYNANITFKLNGKTYKVCKRNILNIDS